LRELEDDFASAAVAVRFVVIGTPEEAAEFSARFGDPHNCLSDPEKKTYRAMGFEEFNLVRLFSDPDLRRRRRENKAAGFSQNWRATRLKNSAQLPGAAVIDGQAILRWIYRGRHPGDLPPISEMLAIARDRLGRE
jgi:AhpC/TSA antioxidant enzyme